jgi:hypothetical protein
MATVQQYVASMKDAQATVAIQLGADLSLESKTTRVLNTSLLGMVAVVAKTLVDKGLITNAELNATLTTAMAEIWPGLPQSQ